MVYGEVGFFYNPLIGGGDDGDMVFVWNSLVCIVAFKPYLQKIFREKLRKEIKGEGDIKKEVPGARIELAQRQAPRDFKSLASTNSATQAHI